MYSNRMAQKHWNMNGLSLKTMFGGFRSEKNMGNTTKLIAAIAISRNRTQNADWSEIMCMNL